MARNQVSRGHHVTALSTQSQFLSLSCGREGGSLEGEQKLEVLTGELITGLWFKECWRSDCYSQFLTLPVTELYIHVFCHRTLHAACQNKRSMYSHPFHFGFGQLTCFGQKNMGGLDNGQFLVEALRAVGSSH